MSELKGKVTYGQMDLSAFLVATLAEGLQVANFPVTFNAKAASATKPQIMNVELVVSGKDVDPSSVYGEIVICDFIAGLKNKEMKNKAVIRLGNNLNHDDFMHKLNSGLRISATESAIDKNADVKDKIKAQIKDLEESGFISDLVDTSKFGDFGILHAMFYCFVEPVNKLANNKVKAALLKIKEKAGLQSFESFVKNEGKAGEKKASKEVGISVSTAKLVRLNKGKKILPVEGKRNILITSALPYVNNVPHLGNIIGCVLSADVFARFTRLSGYNAIYICGTDEYGTATETKAIEEKMTPKQICDKYYSIHKSIYEWFDIDTELFGRTSTPKQTEICQQIFLDLQAAGNTYEEIVEQQFCVACDRFLADRFVAGECPMCHFPDAKGDQCDGCGKLINAIELIKPKCKLCAATPIVKSSKHLFIDLAKITPDLEQWIKKQSVAGKWSYNATFFTNNLLKEGLHGRCITRDLKWGTPVPHPDFSDKVFYVWFDAPIGYISITANYLGADNDDWKLWWQNPDNVENYQFMGKDNTTFHTVIFPSTLIGTKGTWTKLKTISTTEFLNYEIDEATGKPKKFSKSRNTGIFGDDAINTGIPSEVWRYYLLANRPEQQDTVFLWKDFVAKNNNELLKNLGNFSNRCLKFLDSSFGGVVPAYEGPKVDYDAAFFKSIYEKFLEFIDLMEEVKIKDSLRVTMAMSSLCNGYMQETQPWVLAKSDPKRCQQVMNTCIQSINLLAGMLEPFMPSFSAKVYEQMNIKRTLLHETLYEFLKKDSKNIEILVPTGHKIGEPQPIFREISNEEMENWKKQFA